MGDFMKILTILLSTMTMINFASAQSSTSASRQPTEAEQRAAAVCKRVFAVAQEQCVSKVSTNNDNGYGIAFDNCNLNSTNSRDVVQYIFKQHSNGSCDIVYIFRDTQTSLRTYTGLSTADPLAATYETADAIYSFQELTEFVYEGSLRHTILGFIGHSPELNSSGQDGTAE
jgi:hypothetical protein